MADDQKLSLQAFLQVLTSKSLPISRAMTVASKIYKEFNTPARLGELTDPKLQSLGVSDKEDRRLVLSTFKSAGYRVIAVTNAQRLEAKKRRRDDDANGGTSDAVVDDDDDNNKARDPPPSSKNGGPSSSKQKQRKPAAPPSPLPLSSPSPQKRRKRTSTANRLLSDENEYLPGGGGPEAAAAAADDEGVSLGSLDFDEILDQDVLRHKSTVVNRAPVMMAWACVVAERLGFTREEALSIASVYTEMNAISKGVSLGIYDKKREATLDIAHATGGAQPYVDLLGRRVPLYRTASGSWRAFTTEDSSGNSTPGGGGAPPGPAFSYITRALRQTAPAVLGAMRLLAESYDDPRELNRMGFTLYANFRPDVSGWGKRGELKCETLLGLRKEPKREAGLNRENIGAGMIESEDNDQVVVKPEEPDKEPAYPACNVSKTEELFDAPFDEFTAEELSILP